MHASGNRAAMNLPRTKRCPMIGASRIHPKRRAARKRGHAGPGRVVTEWTIGGFAPCCTRLHDWTLGWAGDGAR